jgi:murein DD-endopeptidase MepM/ murein hydrolase activator NlpD
VQDTLRRILPLSLLIAAGIGGAVSHAAIKAERLGVPHPATATINAVVRAATAPAARQPAPVWVWEGKDVDGDGAADFMNPTGKGVRGHDAFGEGEFGASRDGGGRRHEGVDYIARAGQVVKAPMSGYVTKIGYAYAGDSHRFVEISNPALKFEARVFYVDPSVKVGQTVHLGDSIGTMDSLQPRYAGITDHVHLEMYDRGQRIDCEKVIVAELKAPATRG